MSKIISILVFVSIALGGYWLWENRRDDVLSCRDRVVDWYSSLADSTGKGAARAPSSTQYSSSGGSPNDSASLVRGTGADWWKKGDNWTRTKAANLDNLTDTDNDLILSWDDRKQEFSKMVDAVRVTIGRIKSSPAYAYDRNMLSRVQADVDVIAHCLEIGDPLRLADRLPTMEGDLRTFMSGVRWQANVAHPTAPHVHSGAKENSWEPDDGYVFASSSQSDNNLAVIYRGHPYRCSTCNGSGVVVEKIRCPKCQGKGRVPNPLVQGANMISAAAEIANAFSRHPKRIRTRQVNDPGIRCDVCNGHGVVQQRHPCPYCESGTVWR